MSEKCFNQVVNLMKEVTPDRNKIPDDFYGMKKLVSGLGLPVQKNRFMHEWDACCIGKLMMHTEIVNFVVIIDTYKRGS
jgi:hypothetical protein